MFTTSRATLGLAALVLGLSACGGDDDGGESRNPDSSAIQVGDTSLGKVITDANGLTLYEYADDTATQEACQGDCLDEWPVFEGKPTAGSGADASLIGTLERDDGTIQATYGGHPLYYYEDDSEAGDVNGQGEDNIWWAIDAKGAPVASSSDSGDDGSDDDSGDDGGGVSY